MQMIKYIFLGLIQGLTEFLPVSSSAHLVILQDLFKMQQNQLLFDIVLHLGTLTAVVVFLWKDLKYIFNPRVLFYLFLVTAITFIIVLLGKAFFENMFSSVQKVALPLFVTGIILLSTKRFTQGRRRFTDLKIVDAILLGIIQGFSVIPGLSRSGATISVLLFRYIERETAFKFSFLASILAISGAFFFKIKDFSQLGFFEYKYMFFGFLSAFGSGFLALHILLAVMRKARLYLFGYYCLALSLVVGIGSLG
jgi:undecaprenyl-diphosphatase